MTSIKKDQKPESIIMNREQRRAFKKKNKIDPLKLGIKKGKTYEKS